ncbi:hypothetical protein AB0J35_50670 [Nonomuraea angiospora]|uniref:hypothetical protein n=1 Tax=Nonomuraea angiospora TaxID=46172 RepID=UPI00342B7761
MALSPGRGLSVSGARVALVGGQAAATWIVDAGIVVITPLRAFTRAEHTAVTEEGQSMMSFVSGNDSDRVEVVTPSP